MKLNLKEPKILFIHDHLVLVLSSHHLNLSHHLNSERQNIRIQDFIQEGELHDPGPFII